MSNDTLQHALVSWELMRKIEALLVTDKVDVVKDFIGECIGTELNLCNEDGEIYTVLDYVINMPFGYNSITTEAFVRFYNDLHSGRMPF